MTVRTMDQRTMREEILAYKRERILEEAVKLVYERGFTGTTLDDIAAELGVTKPFIYTHFRSKTDLLAALCMPTIELSLDAVTRAAKGPGSPTDRLHRGIVDFTQVVLSRQANIAIYFREEKNLAPEALEQINTLRKKFDRVLSKLLSEGVAAGEFDIKDVSLSALAIGGMISWAYTWHRPEGRLALNDLCERMAALALQMVGVHSRVAAKLSASA
jgi:AcrR family transcriptional regulator